MIIGLAYVIEKLSISDLFFVSDHGRRPGAEFGGTKKFFRGPISGKISIFRVKISDDLFLVIDLVLRIFPFFSHIFRMFTMLNVVYDHFLTRKTQFFTLFMLSCTSDNTTSQNIGGTNAWAVPPPQILGGQSPLGLRLWLMRLFSTSLSCSLYAKLTPLGHTMVLFGIMP